MLKKLKISNYALIEELAVDFHKGYSVITGETGAGKSILLGALGAVMGQRADRTVLKDKTKKCVVEAIFEIKHYDLRAYFRRHNLDYEKEIFIRREILPNEKSRSFVNDTPVYLKILRDLKECLLDIHSQNQNLDLMETSYQYHVLDTLAQQKKDIKTHQELLNQYHNLQEMKKQLSDKQKNTAQQQDYYTFLYEELSKANLQEKEQEQIEQELNALNNAELIMKVLSEAIAINTAEQTGLQAILNQLQNNLKKIASLSEQYEEIFQRIDRVKIELDDLNLEIENLAENIFFDEARFTKLNQRLSFLLNLQAKHNVKSVKELLELQKEFSEKIKMQNNLPAEIEKTEHKIKQIKNTLQKNALRIFENRKTQIPLFIQKTKNLLKDLGMPQADFKIELTKIQEFNKYGGDQISFLFSANKGGNYESLKKIVSGGELSRIMLAVKYILSKQMLMPTIVFDEIDTGVSGEISNKMGDMIASMSKNMQIISISHLPQIAAKGHHHYKVYKKEARGTTTSFLRELNKEQRIIEIAQMLGGTTYSSSAIEHARSLLKS